MEPLSDAPLLYVNGKRLVLPPGRAEVTLLTYLRGVCFLSLGLRWLPHAATDVGQMHR